MATGPPRGPPIASNQDLQWTIPPEATLEDALRFGADVFQHAGAVLPSLPHRDPKRHLPATLSDALAIVHARDEIKKKANAKSGSKSRLKANASTAAVQNQYPGAVEGAGDESAFWMYVEDHFRDITQEDLIDILSLCVPPEDDQALKMLPTGCGVQLTAAQQRALAARLAAAAAPPQPAVQPGEDKAGLNSALLNERRSVRITSRLNRSDDLYRESDEDQHSEDEDDDIIKPAFAAAPTGVNTPQQAQQLGGTGGGSAQQFAPPTGPPIHIPTAADGSAVSTLYDLISKPTLATLATQLQELQRLVGFPADDSPAVNPKSNDVLELRSSLTALASDLSQRLGAEHKLKVLRPRRVGEEDEEDVLDAEHERVGADAEGIDTVAIPSAAYCHPWTRLLLSRPVPPHVQTLATLAVNGGNGFDASRPASAALPGRTPSAAGLLGAASLTPSQAQGLGVAGGTARAGSTSVGALKLITPASSQDTEEEAAGADGVDIKEEEPMSPGGSKRNSRQRAVSNYALMAGKKDPAKTAAAAAARKQQKAVTAVKDAEAALSHPVAQAVNYSIATAVPSELREAKDTDAVLGPKHVMSAASMAELVAAAPQDELAAEILALQSELTGVAVANRIKLKAAVAAMIEDLPRQAERRKEREQEEQDVKDWINAIREAKRAELRARREAAQRESQSRQGKNNNNNPNAFSHLLVSPRPVLGRQQGIYNEDEDILDENEAPHIPYLGADELYDVLAQRDMSDEAFCAVCGDGHSEAPNLIVYCDRCDVAVHQRCYDVHTVPENEWLCWPCAEYEAEQRALGVSQEQIRSPHTLSLDRAPLEGGARSVKCALCPIKYGAFRKTVAGTTAGGGGGSSGSAAGQQQWVHQACALWHSETYVVDGAGAAVIAGLDNIPAKKWSTPCDICGLTDGAVVSCRHPGTCQYNFHVLCARNCGLHLAVRMDRQTQRPQYRAYCAIHSKAQREKDAKMAEAMAAGAHQAIILDEERIRQAEMMEALAYKESERSELSLIRYNLEQCRVLVDLCKRRERLKKQTATIIQQVHQPRLEDPTAAVEFLERVADMEGTGAQPKQIIESLLRTPVHGGGAAGGVGFAGFGGDMVQQQQQQSAIGMAGGGGGGGSFGVLGQLVSGEPPIRGDSGGMSMPGVDSMPPLPEFVPPPLDFFSPYGGGGGDGGSDDDEDYDEQPQSGMTGHRDAAGRRSGRQSNTSKRAAEEAAEAAAAAAAAAAAQQPNKKQKLDDDGLSAVERQKLLSSSEAALLNKKLPTGLKYVPVDRLPSSGGPPQANPSVPKATTATAAVAGGEKEKEAVSVDAGQGTGTGARPSRATSRDGDRRQTTPGISSGVGDGARGKRSRYQ